MHGGHVMFKILKTNKDNHEINRHHSNPHPYDNDFGKWTKRNKCDYCGDEYSGIEAVIKGTRRGVIKTCSMYCFARRLKQLTPGVENV